MAETTSTLNGWGWATGLLIVPLLFYLIRREWSRHLQRQMMVKAATAPQPIAGDEAPIPTDARIEPHLVLHTADSVALEDGTVRRRHEDSAHRAFARLCLVDFGAALGYFLLPWMGSRSGGRGMMDFGTLFGTALMALVIIRYLVHRRRFRAFNLARSRQRQRVYRLLISFLMLPVELAAAVVNPFLGLISSGEFISLLVAPRTRTVVSTVVIVAAGVLAGIDIWLSAGSATPHLDGGSVGLLAAAVLHGWTLSLPRRRTRPDRGLALLVLRVFHVDFVASFLFNGLMAYWRHFGTHFTIVDPAFVWQRQRDQPLRNLLVLLTSYLALACTSLALNSWTSAWHAEALTPVWIGLLVVLPAVVAGWAILTLGKWRIERRFIRGLPQLNRQLDRLDRSPLHADLSFRHVRALCHEDTWMTAVAEFARRSQVALMDLRGYSTGNAGCGREVDLLVEMSMIDRSLFLVASKPQADAAHEMLSERWLRRPHADDPEVEAVFHIYIVQDADERDMQAILDTLVRLAESGASSRRLSFQEEAMRPCTPSLTD